MENSRILKVYESNSSYDKKMPKILLQGKWLENVGYKVGDYFEVIHKDNSIVIKKLNHHK